MKSIWIVLISVLGVFSIVGTHADQGEAGRKGGEAVLKQFAGGLELAEAQAYRNLTIFPVFSKAEATEIEYATLDQALSGGKFIVKELSREEVNVVDAKNDGDSFVFGMSGEVILGAKQDRMLKSDVLFPPHSEWLHIPVYCTERGRWHAVSKGFSPAGISVPLDVRKEATLSESQTGVWSKIGRYQASFEALAPTEALRDVVESPQVKEHSEPYVSEFEDLPSKAPKAVGVVIAVGDRILGIDIFGSRALFGGMWKKLLRSYVVDAVGYKGEGKIAKETAEAFLKELSLAEYSSRATPGVGEVFSISSRQAKGSVLMHRGSVVHLDLFPAGAREPTDEEGRIPRLDYRRNERLGHD